MKKGFVCFFITIIAIFCSARTLIVAAEKIKKGDLVTFGTYEQDNNKKNGSEPIEWIVLDVDESKGKALLLSKYVLDCKLYNEVEESCNVTWEYCTLRKWLNKDFYNIAFTDKEKESIILTKNKNPKTTNNFLIEGIIDGNDTKDRLFLLTMFDLLNPNYGFSEFYSIEDVNRRCAATPYASSLGLFTLKYQKTKDGLDTCNYWLRTSGNTLRNVAMVNEDGSIDIDGCSANGGDYYPVLYMDSGVIEDDAFDDYEDHWVGVRPALWLNLSDDIDTLKHEKPTKPIISLAEKDNQIVISIDEGYGADGYIIYVKAPGKKKYKKIKTLTNNGEKYYTHTIRNAKKGTYSIKVKAYHNVDGVKIFSGYSKVSKVSVSGKSFTDCFKSLKKGDTVSFGSYEQNFYMPDGPEPIEWEVLSIDDKEILLLSKYALDTKEYQESGVEESHDFTEWENCSLRRWLNDIFYYEAFNCAERTMIKVSEVNNWGSLTKDKVFLLSIDDICNPKYGFSERESDEDDHRVCIATQSVIGNHIRFGGGNVNCEDDQNTCRWHILNPYGSAPFTNTYVADDGSVHVAVCHIGDWDYCVRPLIRIVLD